MVIYNYIFVITDVHFYLIGPALANKIRSEPTEALSSFIKVMAASRSGASLSSSSYSSSSLKLNKAQSSKTRLQSGLRKTSNQHSMDLLYAWTVWEAHTRFELFMLEQGSGSKNLSSFCL